MAVLDRLGEQACGLGERLEPVQRRVANVRIVLECRRVVRTGGPDEVDGLGDVREVEDVTRHASRSKREGVREHAISDGVMHLLGEIDPIAEEQLELLLQLNFVDEAAPTLELHEQVDVALRMSCTPGDRAVDADVRRAVAGREP